jgi:hypothetical protein
MPFLMIWWKHIAIAFAIIALLGYIAVIKHQRNAARLELKEFKLAIDQERVKQQLKNAAIERESIAIQNVLVQRHADNIGKVRDYYDKRLIMYRDANAALDNRLRVEANNYRARLSEAVKAASESAKGGRNSDPAIVGRDYEVLREACAITSADYNALYQAWETECQIKGCQ